MNFLFKLSVICMLVLSLFACNNDENADKIIPFFEIKANDQIQNFGAESDVRYVTINTNQEFTATSSDPSWCMVKKIDDNVDNLKISVTENKGTDDRIAEIVVSSPGFQSITITVKQSFMRFLSVKEESGVLIEDDQLDFTLEVSANVPYTFDLPNWIMIKSELSAGNNVKTWFFVATPIAPGLRLGNISVCPTDENVKNKVVVPIVQKSHVRKTASWLFDNPSNLTKASIGKDLIAVSKDPDALFLSVDGPHEGNRAVRVPLNSYFLADHGIVPKSGENDISEYTLFFEFKIPAAGRFYTFFQTNLANNDDGEIFVRNSIPPTIGVGATGYAGNVEVGTWHRLYLSFKPGDIKFFMDGSLILTSTSTDKRFRVSTEGIILCGGPWTKKDDNEFDVAEISIWNGALSVEQMQEIENNRQ